VQPGDPTAIARLAENDVLAAMHESIQQRLKRVRFIGNEESAKWEAAAAEHEEMIRALEARDGDRLAEVLARHLEHTWERVRNAV
jgi:DNA-binding GntR family transcriptional regulator